MKRFTKFLCTFLCLLMSAVCVLGTGCSQRRQTGEEKVDTGKKQIVVACYYGGYGTQWLKNLKTQFETKHANDKFADGTTGVQIQIVENKQFETSNIMNTYQSWTYDMIFCNDSYNYRKMVEKDELLDITDMVTETIAADGVSIDEKIDEQHQAWYKVNGKYYGLPWTEGSDGIEYDKTLWKEHNLYLKANGDFVESEDDVKGYGPNGKTGVINGVDYSSDDGLPVTYDDFYKVCDKMLDEGITPLTSSASLPAYVAANTVPFYVDYEGSAAVRQGLPQTTYLDCRFDYEGYTDYVVFRDAFTADITTYDVETRTGGVPNIVENEYVDINGIAKAFQQPGLYYAVKWLYTMMKTQGYYEKTSGDHIAAQTGFYYSTKKGQPIAMLMDGVHWYNECKSSRTAFDDKYPGEGHEYGYLPIPKASADMVSTPTLLESGAGGAGFISNKIAGDSEKVALCKEFLQSAFTNEALANFTIETSTTAPYDYTMSESQLAQCSSYGRDIYALHTTATYVVGLRPNATAIANPMLCNWQGILQTALYGNNPSGEFSKSSGANAEEYFSSIGRYYAQKGVGAN